MRAVRWGIPAAVAVAAGAVALAFALGGDGGAADAAAYERYNRDLLGAQKPLIDHLADDAVTSLARLPDQFARGEVDGRRFGDVAGRWERDFAAARDAVGRLDPPAGLRRANEAIGEAVDQYVGLAALYRLAAEQGEYAQGVEAPSVARAVRGFVRRLLAQAREMRARADRVYDLGRAAICEEGRRLGASQPGFCITVEE